VESATMYKCGQVQSAQEYIMYMDTAPDFIDSTSQEDIFEIVNHQLI